MKKILVFAIFIASLVNVSFAGECDGDSNYYYKRGHNAVPTQYYFDWFNVHNISICSIDLDASWKNVLKNSISQLNSELSKINTFLRFSYKTGNKCQVPVSFLDISNENILGRGYSKASPYGPSLVINSNGNFSSTLEKKSTLMHELLHVVGLGHTGYRDSGYVKLPNTDSIYDLPFISRSLMCTKIGTPPVIHFNKLDKRSIEIMY